ncbi:hypothetical protein BH09PSE3_BH09PSE3_03950 [soil metagenome]
MTQADPTSKPRRWQKPRRKGRLLTIALSATAVVAGGAFLMQGRPSFAETRPVSVTLDPSAIAVRPTPLTVGVAVHFGIGGDFGYVPDTTARLIDQIGFDSVRDDLSWFDFDRSGGMIPSRLAGFLALTRARPLLILTAKNQASPDTNPPLDARGRAAYAGFVARVAKSAGAKGAILELGNEWNMNAAPVKRPWLTDAGQPDDPRAASNYAPLARAGALAIRSTGSNATILSGAIGIDPTWRWTSALVRDGAPALASGLSLHIYNHCEANTDDRTAQQAIGQLNTMRKTLSSSGLTVPPIYVTEVGWPTSTSCKIERDVQANNMAQFLLWASSTSWVRGVWIYQFKDQGRNAAEIEDNFGLYDFDYKPKPAACFVKESIALIHSAQGSAIRQPTPNVYLLQQSTVKGPRLIAWTGKPGSEASLRIDNNSTVTARPLCGTSSTGSDVTITATPTVIDLPAGAKVNVLVTPR